MTLGLKPQTMTLRSIRIALISSLIAMVVGHIGATELDWHLDPISTFAARAPLHIFVTASMLLSALAILLLGYDISLRAKSKFAIGYGILPCIAGASAAGLLMVAAFEEPVRWTFPHEAPSAEQIRVQAFHDSGLLLFYYGSLLTLALLGAACAATTEGRGKYWGILPPVFAIASYWGIPNIPLPNDSGGIKQRISLLLIWGGLTSYAFLIRRHQRIRSLTEGDAAHRHEDKAQQAMGGNGLSAPSLNPESGAAVPPH